MCASLFEPLDKFIETFITKLSKSTERVDRSQRTLKKPKMGKAGSNGYIDTWTEVVELHFEEKSREKKQDISALTTNLKETALNCVIAKKANELHLLNRFGSGVQGHQARMKFDKRRQGNNEAIDKFLDDFKRLRRRSNPDYRISERNLATGLQFMDGVRSDELKTMLVTHITWSADSVPTADDLRVNLRKRKCLLGKPRVQNR